jgi:ABC-type transporter Mla maintaining outer membrane lipid asymmetry permease subunit MlaE
MKAQEQLHSARTIIVLSCSICVLLTIVATIITHDWLFGVAGVLFLIAGIMGIIIVKNLKSKMGIR